MLVECAAFNDPGARTRSPDQDGDELMNEDNPVVENSDGFADAIAAVAAIAIFVSSVVYWVSQQ